MKGSQELDRQNTLTRFYLGRLDNGCAMNVEANTCHHLLSMHC